MSIQEDAQQLISHATSFSQQGTAVTATASADLNSALGALQQIENMATESMATVNSFLGSGHAGVGGIGATANSVSQTAQEATGAIQQAVESVLTLSHAIVSHGNAVSSVGHQLLQGGG